uniref:COMM domain-containing protein 5 n=1 Tax=Eptatretus burgeri TaxID=7764 RepID=A0A8C4R9K6_EPTBU
MTSHSQAGSPQGCGANLFLGVKPSLELQALRDNVEGVDRDTFRRFLEVIVRGMEDGDCTDLLRSLLEVGVVTKERVSWILSGVYFVVHTALRHPALTPQVFKEELCELGLPEDLIADILTAVFGQRRKAMIAARNRKQQPLPRLSDCCWRVDVAISTSCLARALQPSVMMNISLSDGTERRFEVSVNKFQELRYNVALLLKQMGDLENKKILKIEN